MTAKSPPLQGSSVSSGDAAGGRTIPARYCGASGGQDDLFKLASVLVEKRLSALNAAQAAQRRRLAQRLRILKRRSRERAQAAAEQEFNRRVLELHRAFDRRFKSALAEAENECIELAAALSSEILNAHCAAAPEAAVARLARALAGLLNRHDLTITVNPADREAAAAWLQSQQDLKGARLIGAAEIKSGNALVGTAAGTIELNWERELGILKRRLLSSAAARRNNGAEVG